MKEATLMQRLLIRRCRRALQQRARVVETGDAEAVHDLRVATRRLEEMLEFLGPALPSGPCKRLKRRTRAIRRSLGQTRDVDVMRELVRALRRRVALEHRRALDPLAGRLTSEAETLRRAGRGLKIRGLRRQVLALGDRLSHPESFSWLRRGREVLGARVRKLEKALPAARAGEAGAVHSLRIAIKRYRYSLEILEESGVRRVGPPAVAARALQGELGRLHDLDSLIELVEGGISTSASRTLLRRLRGDRRVRLRRLLLSLDRFEPAAALSLLGGPLSPEVAA